MRDAWAFAIRTRHSKIGMIALFGVAAFTLFGPAGCDCDGDPDWGRW